MAFFSFRAECPAEVIEFERACALAKIRTSLVKRPDGTYPDVEVELETPAGIDALRDVMRSIVNGHVMLQTLRECRLKDNNLERDYDLE